MEFLTINFVDLLIIVVAIPLPVIFSWIAPCLDDWFRSKL